MGMSTDADMSLTELVNDLHEEIDFLRKKVSVITESRDKWKKLAEILANSIVKKLGE